MFFLCVVVVGYINCVKLFFEYGVNIVVCDKNQCGSIYFVVENEKSRNVENVIGKIGIIMYKYFGYIGKDSFLLCCFFYKVKGIGNIKI